MPITAAELAVALGLDTKDFESGLKRAHGGWTDFDKAVTSSGPRLAQLGSQLSSAGAAMTAGLTLPILALGAGLVKVATDFDDAFDRIRIGTGVTGAALAGLEQSFRSVVADVPASFEKASQAITQLAQRTGLTGIALETLTKQELELARITGTDLTANIAATTRAFGDWSISSDKQSEALDFLFKTSQQTGIGVTKLTETVVQFGAPMRALGFSFEESAALMGKWEKEGVNMEAVLGGLRRGLGSFAKAGLDPAEMLKTIIERMKSATDETQLTGEAFKIFGQRAAVDMFRAMKEGRFDIDNLVKSIQSSKESILTAAAFTNDYSENLTILSNRVKLAAEPLAKELFQAINNLIPLFTGILAKVTDLIKFFSGLPGPVKTATVVLLGVAAVGGPIALMVGQVIGALSKLTVAYNATAAAAVRFGAASKLAFLGVAGGVVTAGVIAQEGFGLLADGMHAVQKQFKDFADAPKRITSTAEGNTKGFLSTAFGKPIESFVNVDLPKHAGAAGSGLGKLLSGGGGAKSGADALKKILDEQITAVNNYLGKITKVGQVSEDVWKSMSSQGRTALLKLAAAYDVLTNAITRMGAEMAGGQSVNAGVRAAFDTLIAKSKETATTITATHTIMGGQLRDFYMDLPVMVGRASSGMTESWSKVPVAMETAFERMKRSMAGLSEAQAAQAKRTTEWADLVKKANEDASEKTAKALQKTRAIYDDFFESVLGGWARFANDTLRMLNGMNSSIPSSLGGILEKIAGLFTKSTATAQKWAQSITGIIGGVATFMGSRNQGKVQGMLGGAMAGASIGGSIGMLVGGPVGAGIGAGIGAVGGAIAGLFGSGKSAAQKAEEERRKNDVAVQTEQAIANLTAGIIDGLEKGRQLLENLANFVAVPKEAIKKFFKQLETLLTSFVEMSAKFNSEGLTKAKEVSENLGSVFGFLADAVGFSQIIRNLEEVSDESIARLMSAIARIETGFEAIIEKMETTTVKRAARLADKLMTVFGFIHIIPDTLKAVVEAPDVSDEILSRIFANATSIIDKFSIMIDTFQAYAMTKLAKSAKQFTSVFESVAVMLGALKAFGEYTPLEDSVFDAVTSDLTKLVNAINGWVDLGTTALTSALNLEDVMRRLRESIARSGVAGVGGSSVDSLRSSSTVINRQQSAVTNYNFGGFTVGGSDPGAAELQKVADILKTYRMHHRMA